MDVSIIIVNYKTASLIKNCIESIEKNTKDIRYEIIIVDNNSLDNSLEILKKLEKENIKIISSEKNLGFGKANNIAAKYAQGDYLFLLNPDTLLINNSIKILYDNFKKTEKCGVVGGNLYDINLKPTHSFHMELPNTEDEIAQNYSFFYKKFNLKCNRAKKYLKQEQFNFTQDNLEVGYICGADIFTSREIFNKFNGFDPDFFMFYEETELESRIKKAGYKIISVPKAKIIHLEGKSFEFKETRFKMMTESKYMYFYKVYGKKAAKDVYKSEKIMCLYKIITRCSPKYFKMLKIINQSYKKIKNI